MPALRRNVSTSGLAAYGIGGMLGGGIYALVGKVVGEAGSLAWISFVLAMLVAAPTALSYLVLASRFPKSGGEAHYVLRAFGRPRVAMLIGWLVALSGLVSMATLAVAFAGYAVALVPGAHPGAVAAAFLIGLAAINLRGIRLTSGVNILCTLVEVSGLVIVIVAGAAALSGGDATPAAAAAPAAAAPSATTWGVIQGAQLAFYAFIGFEDMVNIAEEVRSPKRAYRIAIPTALLVVSTIYVAIALLATRTVPLEVLASSSAPLGEVVNRGLPALPDRLFDVIALFAVANSALLNCVMASRLLYGMADEGLLPASLGAVNHRYGTPHRAVALVLVVSLALALTGSLTFLAGTTGLILLVVFATINAALVVLLRRPPDDAGAISVPIAAPMVGAALALAMMIAAPTASLAVTAAAIGAGLLVGLIHRPTAATSENSTSRRRSS